MGGSEIILVAEDDEGVRATVVDLLGALGYRVLAARDADSQLVPGIAVLFTSGYAENAIVHGGRLDPGVALLGKPYTHDALARKVRQSLDARR